jgi:hypothetical protein
LGTQKENMQDCAKKKRTHFAIHPEMIKRGIEHGGAKLAESQVIEIRSQKQSCAKLAAKFGVCPMTISLIKRNKIWTHI